MPQLRPKLLMVAYLLAAAALTGAVLVCRRPPPDLASWDRRRLDRELRANGYRTHAEPADRYTPEGRLVLTGLYAWRPSALTVWEEAACQPTSQAAHWHGLVVARPEPAGVPAEPDELRLG